jgi:hypothetical protein
MSDTQETPATVLVKLRARMNDLLRMGVLSPEGSGMYQQTVLQLLQEFDRRKASCLEQAEHLRRQAAAAEAQAAAFGVSGSVLFAVVNGYIDLEEKRIREDQERQERDNPREEPAAEPAAAEKPAKKKKPVKPAADAEAPPPGAVPDAPDEG